MDSKPGSSLSASLEDYLETIFWVVAAEGAARAKDIARQLKVKASSVTGALQTLAEKEYIHYRPYEAVTLTREGFEKAARVVQRHRILREFFAQVLGVDEAVAEQRARRLEHDVGDEVAARMAALLEYVQGRDGMRQELAAFLAQREGPAAQRAMLPSGSQTVADLKSGQKGVIVSVRREGAISRRLADMGLGRGALIEVEGVAPMGDPIRVRIRRYRLSLRRSEAAAILVVGR
ncbi:MAG: metal-dependent transcriptional regulator [Phycisphaerales bacterium]|nr:MAG: metal-dependent transcriptional regulator [Phycisphaerales bacterium]